MCDNKYNNNDICGATTVQSSHAVDHTGTHHSTNFERSTFKASTQSAADRSQ